MKDKKFFSFIFEFEKKVLFLLFLIFLIGFIWGCYFFFNKSFTSYDSALFLQIPEIIFKKVLFKNLLFLTVTFLLGYTVIGFPFIFFTVLGNGVYCGISLCVFTAVYGFKGCFVSSLLLFPYYLIFVSSHFFVTFSSLRLSASLYNVFKDGTRYISPKAYSKPHIIKFCFYSLSLFLCSALFCFILLPVVIKIL